jgi:hypothetical protein
MMRDDESGRAHDFGESKLRGAVPAHGATLVLLTFAQKYDCRLDRDQEVNKSRGTKP